MKTERKLFAEESLQKIKKRGFTADHPEWFAYKQLLKAANILRMEKLSEDDILTPFYWDFDWFLELCKKPYKERLGIAIELLDINQDRLVYLEKQSILNEIEKWATQIELLGGPDAPGASVKARLIHIDELNQKLENLLNEWQ